MRSTMFLAPVLAALAIAGCGSDDPETAAPAGAGASARQDAFPVTIDHKLGSTTIERAPERVVVVGLREQDPLLALGIVPAATTEWFGAAPRRRLPVGGGRARRRHRSPRCSRAGTGSRSSRSPRSAPT